MGMLEDYNEWYARHKMKQGGEAIGPSWGDVKGNLVALALGGIVWAVFTPSIEDCKDLHWWWVSYVFLRTFIIGCTIYGGMHFTMYGGSSLRGTFDKFNPTWPKDEQHVRDRFYTMRSFVINAAMEVWLLNAWGSGRVPYYNTMADHPVKTAAMFLLYPFWRDLHFFIYHVAMHQEPLYRWVHAHHHKSYNPGPWNGLSFTIIESIVTFTGPSIPCLVTSAHPLLFMYANLLAFVNPVYGHHGHSDLSGSYFHYLHHSKATCNYGMTLLPLDILWGSWYAGEHAAAKKE
mmetsp:Transcript_19693/g.51248  ORF Transcript_19693/g.51248 Transcript_19693/m.51248 type:complete len:289 (+) Transcript_19693:54-920(+)